MLPVSAQSVNEYWAGMFGCDITDLRPAHGHAYAHVGFTGYLGVHAMMFGEAAPIVSVPRELLSRAVEKSATWQPGSIRAAAQFTDLLGARAGRVIGPATLAYADGTTLRPPNSDHNVRRLRGDSDEDRQLLLSFREACTPDEWEAGGSDIDHDVVFGVMDGTSLAAVAGYEVWGGRIAHIAITSHPAKRGRANGRAAVLTAAHHALRVGLIPQYRTLESNLPSLGIAARLGFAPFATSLAVRSLP